MTRPGLLLIVPAYQRFAIAEVCFRQLADLCATVSPTVDATALVIADDQNLDAAAAAGLATLEAPNHLGARLNTGYAYAAAEGFTHACAADSDSWLDPVRFHRLPGPRTVTGSVRYTLVDARRRARSELALPREGIRRIIPLPLLHACGYAPLEPHRGRGCHVATLATIRATNPRVTVRDTPGGPLDEVGFVSDLQITDPALFTRRALVREWRGDPFHDLDTLYPAHLVEAIRAVCAPIGATQMHPPRPHLARGFRLRPGPHRFAVPGAVVDTGETFRTADPVLADRLAAEPLLEEVTPL